MDKYIIKGNKKLRYGYTTGSCSAAAAKASAMMLLGGKQFTTVNLDTPKGFNLNLDIHDAVLTSEYASCAIIKDSGDDPDITNGMKVYAMVKLIENGISILGGKGIGTVTQKGLRVAVGQPAINPGPRKMIEEALYSVAKQFNYFGGFEVEISAPEGEKLAKKTFNEKLGIVGGLSILGTTGIVEPMSEDALIQSLFLELNILKGKGFKEVIMCPGNYGYNFAKETLKMEMTNSIKVSNYMGEMLERASDFNKITLISHIGKGVKLASGMFNTHSKYGDARREIFCAHAILAGTDTNTAKELLEQATSEAMLTVLEKQRLLEATMQSIGNAVLENCTRKVLDNQYLEVILFSLEKGVLFKGEINA